MDDIELCLWDCWSAVVLVKETNFEKKASYFVETYRTVENSIIYDYKIEHQDGSILKVFMTGETMSSSTKSNLYAYAREHGITEEQLMVKEYITQNAGESNDMFKGIYEKLDSQIEKHESTIDQLQKELQAAKQEQIPYLQLANEISATYPQIKTIHIGQGAQVTVETQEVISCIMIKVHTDSLMDTTAIEQLKRWVQVRLQVENVEVDNKTNF